VPTYLICEEARRHVTVALGGDGADELLGGYMCWARHCLSPLPGSKDEKPSLTLMQQLARWLAPAPVSGSPLVRRYAEECRIYFTDPEQQSLGLVGGFQSPTDFSRYSRDRIDDLLRYDTDHYLPGDVLVKTDRASMAHGLELRAPFLDVELASFCMSLPDTLKVDKQREKLLLREAYGDCWVPEVKDRPKQGFGGPMESWLKQPEMRDLKRDLLGNRQEPLFGLLDFDRVQTYTDRDDQKTWSLLILALWMRKHRCALPKN
jgi:asparagine synthase (glutamine-hydrolysing)